MLPRASTQNNNIEKSTTPVPPTPSKDTKKAVIYVSGNQQKPDPKQESFRKQTNPGLQKSQSQKIPDLDLDVDSSAKESEDEDDDYEIPNPEGVSAADKAKLQRLQIRNLKRLREKVNKQIQF